jgi:hypothetical protein
LLDQHRHACSSTKISMGQALPAEIIHEWFTLKAVGPFLPKTKPIHSCLLACSRVTRLGEFSPLGYLFT